jgi:cell wall-associated NlpC family hydrolase
VVGFASDSIVDQRVRATITLDPRVEVLGVEPGPASCASGSGGFVCQATVRRGQMVQARVIVRVRPGSSRTGDIVAGLSATAGGETVVAQPVRVVLLNEVVTPAPWPPPTAGPTSTPGWEGPTDGPVPTAAAPRSTGAPCLGAVLAAVSRQGARYSQGGALENDPLGTDGLPLPRTGPRSFDCSGLVWWAYAQAGVAIGSTTAQQINDGVMIACSLDDLRGAATRCWAPGDLIFLRSDIGRHVAIYAGDGLFMDCFNHRVGCVLHDVSQDSFYRAHFWQARRVVSGCEGMTLDPGEPVPPPLDGTPVGDAPGMCVAEPPSFGSPIEELSGCGPPVRLGGRVYQLDSTVGFVGVTGLTTGPHLHLGLRMRSYDGTIPQTNICTEPWLQGRVPPPGVSCWTEMADPLDFLPRALGGETTAGGTPIPEGAPYQLPPPGHPGALAMTPVPGATPVGQYWSPHPDGGRYGGGSALEWLRDAVCSVWRGGPLCN